jgi:hypothetical protein
MNNNTLDLRDTSARFLEMYGVPSIGAWYDTEIDFLDCTWGKDQAGANKMLVMSMLSDVQEMVARGLETSNLDEEARQVLNRAKWVISNKL